MERTSANGLFFHRNCFKCSHCNCKLKMGNYSLSKGEGGEKGKFFCSVHYRQLFMSNPEAINYSRADAPKREQSKTDLPAEKEKSTQQMNGRPEQEMTKSTSVEDATLRTEWVHISVEEVTEQSSKLPENGAEMLSGDEHHEQNGDLPTDKDLPSEDLVFNGVHLEEEVIASEEEMITDLLANEEASHDDLLENEVGNANGDDLEDLEKVINTVVKLDQAPQPEQPASITDISIASNSSLHHQFSHDESEKEPIAILTLDKQVASLSHEPEKPTYKAGITDVSTCIPPRQNGDESENLTKTTFTALEQEIVPQIEDKVTIKADKTTEKAETSCVPCHQSCDKSDSETFINLTVDQEVAPEEGEQANKTDTDTDTEKHHISCIHNHQESNKATNSISLDHETTGQNGEPKQLTCTIQSPTHQKRVMLIV